MVSKEDILECGLCCRLTRNHFGQLTNYTFGNDVVANRTYTTSGLPLKITTSKGGVNFVNATYNFSETQGTLTSRSRNDIVATTSNSAETFTYDNLKRLKTYGKFANHTVNYSTMGNITFKTDAGNFAYGNPNRPFQITEQTNMPIGYDEDLLTATYTSDTYFSQDYNRYMYGKNHRTYLPYQ